MELTQEQYNQLLQKGLKETVIKEIASKKGYTLPGQKSGGFLTGVVKGAIGDIARPTAQMLQGAGQRIIATTTPLSLEQVRKSTGFKSLDDTTPEGQSVVQSLKTTGKVETAGRVVANIASFFIPTSKATQVAGRALSTTGKITTKLGIGLSSKEAPLVQAYKAKYSVPQRIMAALKGEKLAGKPMVNAETAIRQSLFGTESHIGIQAKRAGDNIWKEVIAPVLNKSKEQVHFPSFINELREQVRLVPERTRRKELFNALEAFADDYKDVGRILYPKLQNLKNGWAKFLPDKTWRGKPIGSAFKEIQNMAADLARNKIYKLFPDDVGKAAYFDYGNLKNLQELGQKAMTGAKLKGGAGSFISGLYDKVITPIATTGGLTLYKVGEGLQFIGAPGAKILGHLFK